MPQLQFIQTTPEELKEAILDDVRSELAEFSKKFHPKSPEEYLTKDEVCSLLKISKPTLDRYADKG